MKTLFYDRTSYSLSSEAVPECFLELDDYFDTITLEREQFINSPFVLLAETVCGRMADVEMYAFLLEDIRKRDRIDRSEDDRAAILTRSFAFGYLEACRALLDSCVITIATLYSLPLNAKDLSVSSHDFWHQLVLYQPAVHRRYHPLRLFFNEIVRWQKEAVFRIPPLLVLHSHYGPMPSRDVQLRVIDDSHYNMEQLSHEPYSVEWIDPLDLHLRWKPRLLALCEKTCLDIRQCSQARMAPPSEQI